MAGGAFLTSNKVCSQKRDKSIGFGFRKKAFALSKAQALFFTLEEPG